MPDYQNSIIATFTDLDTANKALRRLRDAQQNRGVDIKDGAVVVGTAEGVMPVMDLDDVGLGDVAGNALDLFAYLGIGATKIAAETAIAGGLLLLSSARRAAALGTSLLLMPAKSLLGILESDKALDYFGAVIEPGTCAVVAVVDEPDVAAQVMAELSESGGQVIEVDVNSET
jgi:uncharacterized membrane protein